MKNAIILHGTGGTPDSFWHPSIKEFLKNQGYQVWLPQLPETDNPTLEAQLPFVLQNGKFTEETILIGHSAGCPLILAILEQINIKIKKAVLIAGYCENTGVVQNQPNLKSSFGWKIIKQNVQEIIFINSDNDPWGCDHKQGQKMFEELGGTLIIRHGEGHMGSDKFNQPYRDFPLLKKILEL